MIATNLEQSKKLVELGIDTSTADMWWSDRFVYYNPTPIVGIATEKNTLYSFKWGNEEIPAWSLSALLELLPPHIDSYDLNINKYNEEWGVYYEGYFEDFNVTYLKKVEEKTLIDATFEMVCWLKENKYI